MLLHTSIYNYTLLIIIAQFLSILYHALVHISCQAHFQLRILALKHAIKHKVSNNCREQVTYGGYIHEPPTALCQTIPGNKFNKM